MDLFISSNLDPIADPIATPPITAPTPPDPIADPINDPINPNTIIDAIESFNALAIINDGTLCIVDVTSTIMHSIMIAAIIAINAEVTSSESNSSEILPATAAANPTIIAITETIDTGAYNVIFAFCVVDLTLCRGTELGEEDCFGVGGRTAEC